MRTNAMTYVFGTQVRFGIMCAHELCEIPKGERGWDSQLNVEQINRGLITLNQAFAADRSR